MTTQLFMDDTYRTTAPARVTRITEQGGVVLDQSLFYATSGGQPGDRGRLSWAGGTMAVATTVKGQGGEIVLIPAADETPSPEGAEVEQDLDWGVRLRHMRMHTALHLLTVVIPCRSPAVRSGRTKVASIRDADRTEDKARWKSFE